MKVLNTKQLLLFTGGLIIMVVSLPLVLAYAGFLFMLLAPSEKVLTYYLQATTLSTDKNIETLINNYITQNNGLPLLYKNLLPPITISEVKETEAETRGYNLTYLSDNLPENTVAHVSLPSSGKQKIKKTLITLGLTKTSVELESRSIIEYPKHGEVVVGASPQEQISEKTTEIFTQARELFFAEKKEELAQIMSDANIDITSISEDVKAALKESTVASIEYKETLEPENGITVIGHLTIHRANCNTTGTIEIFYDFNTQTYRLSNILSAAEELCVPKRSNYGGIIVSCRNCIYAPIGRSYALPASYIPPLVKTLLPGGGAVTPDTKKALTLLFNDASANGITLTVRSSYRSYETQVTTFESYVQNEIASGKTRAQAEAAANTYSARPGHSEHQLGTTIDVKDGERVYDYIAKNAVTFGFIVSYPYNCKAFTGYVYEPWHIRYVGTKIAAEMSTKGYLQCSQGRFPAKYLEEIKLYENM